MSEPIDATIHADAIRDAGRANQADIVAKLLLVHAEPIAPDHWILWARVFDGLLCRKIDTDFLDRMGPRLRRFVEVYASIWLQIRLVQSLVIAGRLDDAAAKVRRWRHSSPNVLGDWVGSLALIGRLDEAVMHIGMMDDATAFDAILNAIGPLIRAKHPAGEPLLARARNESIGGVNMCEFLPHYCVECCYEAELQDENIDVFCSLVDGAPEWIRDDMRRALAGYLHRDYRLEDAIRLLETVTSATKRESFQTELARWKEEYTDRTRLNRLIDEGRLDEAMSHWSARISNYLLLKPLTQALLDAGRIDDALTAIAGDPYRLGEVGMLRWQEGKPDAQRIFDAALDAARDLECTSPPSDHGKRADRLFTVAGWMARAEHQDAPDIVHEALDEFMASASSDRRSATMTLLRLLEIEPLSATMRKALETGIDRIKNDPFTMSCLSRTVAAASRDGLRVLLPLCDGHEATAFPACGALLRVFPEQTDAILAAIEDHLSGREPAKHP